MHKVVATNPQGVADVVATLSWTVQDEDGLIEYLHRCAHLSVRSVPGAAHASVTTTVHGAPFTAACTNEATLEAEAHQYAAGDGPILHALRTGDVVGLDLATGTDRWPELTADARTIGVRSFLAIPIGHADARVGALNVYGTGSGRLDRDEEDLLRMIVDLVGRTLTDYVRLGEAQDRTVQLREAMATRAPIEQAKGILMAAHQVTAEEAFRMLRTQSQNSNTTLNAVAAAFVAAHST